METSTLKQYSVPISIIIAGVFIASAVFFSSSDNVASEDNKSFGNNLSVTADNVRAVEDSEHILGNIAAAVTIIEYSDYECPFCQRVHPTLKQIVEDFDGDVRWVFRHFPLTSIHSRALDASIAADCIANIGGNDAFWTFTDAVFSNQQHLGTELYERLAVSLGISVDAFRLCQNDSSVRDAIQVNYQNALDSGGRGTPFIIVTNKNGDTFPFSGALPYAHIKSIIEQALAS